MYDVVIEFCSQTAMAEFISGIFPKEVAKGYNQKAMLYKCCYFIHVKNSQLPLPNQTNIIYCEEKPPKSEDLHEQNTNTMKYLFCMIKQTKMFRIAYNLRIQRTIVLFLQQQVKLKALTLCSSLNDLVD